MAELIARIEIDENVRKLVDEKIAELKKQYIPKDQYEQRLKADMVAMLTDIQLEIEKVKTGGDCWELAIKDDCKKIIQQKINALKENKDEVKITKVD